MGDSQALEQTRQEARDLVQAVTSWTAGNTPGPGQEPRAAILTLQAGAGGQDAQDWTQQLAGMYSQWAQAHGVPAQWVSLDHGERGGLRSATIRLGPGSDDATRQDTSTILRSEHGVHRVSHLSPRDRSGRRHTSFASIEVIPELPPREEQPISPRDLRTQTFRSSGPGGQHVQKVATGVRVIHLPTGVTATCQTERSQQQNRQYAMTLLQARLAARQAEEDASQRTALRGPRQTPSFGSRIRSYIFLPSRLVRDHRTQHTHHDPDAVLAGDIDGFLQAHAAWSPAGHTAP